MSLFNEKLRRKPLTLPSRYVILGLRNRAVEGAYGGVSNDKPAYGGVSGPADDCALESADAQQDVTGHMMRQQSTAALVGRAAFVVLIVFALVAVGIAMDMLAGTGPLGTLAFVAVGSVFGTIMICAIFLSSFPKPDADQAATAPARTETRPGD